MAPREGLLRRSPLRRRRRHLRRLLLAPLRPRRWIHGVYCEYCTNMYLLYLRSSSNTSSDGIVESSASYLLQACAFCLQRSSHSRTSRPWIPWIRGDQAKGITKKSEETGSLSSYCCCLTKRASGVRSGPSHAMKNLHRLDLLPPSFVSAHFGDLVE